MENTTASDDGDFLLLYYMPPRWALNAELVIVVIIFILGVPGNALIVTVQWKNKNKTSTDYLVMVMGIYEFIGSLLNTTLKIFRDVVPVWELLSSRFLCKTQPFLYFFTQYGSGVTLCVLAIDRFIKTMFPLSRWYGVKQSKIISVIILLHTIVICGPHIYLENWDPVSLQCALLWSHFLITKALGVYGSIMMLCIFFIMSLSYLSIAVSLKRRHAKKLKSVGLNYAYKVKSGYVDTERSTSVSDTKPRVSVTMASVDYGKSEDTKSTSNGPELSRSDNAVVVAGEKPTLLGSKPPQSNTTTVSASEKAPVDVTRAKRTMLTLEGRNVHKLTVLMFFISVFYVATYLLLWYLYMTNPIKLGAGVLQLSFSIPMLNCISNPVMYFSMSSRFRQNVKVLLFSDKRRF